jgi:hypothetical protein
VLNSKSVTASFFVVGTQVTQFPAELVAEQNAGHSMCSHTNTHADLTTLSTTNIVAQFRAAEVAIASTGVCRRPVLYRPPYGSTTTAIANLLRNMGYRGILWNVDTLDWSLAQTNPTKMINDFNTNLNALVPQGIVHLQHDLLQASVNTVSQVIDIIRSKSPAYQFVTVERCLWGPNFRRNPSYAYSYASCGASLAGWPTPTVAEPCPVSEWSEWSPCSSNCGAGTQTRVRLSLPPSLRQTLSACASTTFIQSQACTVTPACANTCVFSAWTNWGACSDSCGGGTRIQTRSRVSGGTVATCGPLLRMEVCNTQPCVARRVLRRGEDGEDA